ncbi:MAG: hypothetical protein HQM11_03090 [SAR324 cluster bacterium]|nr:hypothetical protein [SAR324 cluster bacterium]
MSQSVKKLHILTNFICLPCGKHHRFETGVDISLYLDLPNDGTWHELIDQMPEFVELLEQDEFMMPFFLRFLQEHEEHDIRFLNTLVHDMNDLVELRQQHLEQMIRTYETWQQVQSQLTSLHIQATAKSLHFNVKLSASPVRYSFRQIRES